MDGRGFPCFIDLLQGDGLYAGAVSVGYQVRYR